MSKELSKSRAPVIPNQPIPTDPRQIEPPNPLPVSPNRTVTAVLPPGVSSQVDVYIAGNWLGISDVQNHTITVFVTYPPGDYAFAVVDRVSRAIVLRCVLVVRPAVE